MTSIGMWRRAAALAALACALAGPDRASAASAEPAPAAASLYALPTHWTDDSGAPVLLDRWAGSTVLITMAYGSCRKVCSVTLHTLEQLQEQADRQHRAVEFVVVSYDPKNDTPASWAEYRKRRRLARANWHFLSGGERDTRRLSHWLGLADFWSLEGHVLHDFKISILSPAGVIVRQLGWQDRQEAALP